jgi:hypothetical protein
MTPETTIGVVGCNPLWLAVNVKADDKASYKVSVSLLDGEVE